MPLCRTNVVKVFNEAIRKGLECKEKPPDDFFDEVMEFLHADDRPTPAAAPAPAAGPAGGEEAAGAPAQDAVTGMAATAEWEEEGAAAKAGCSGARSARLAKEVRDRVPQSLPEAPSGCSV